MNIVGIAACTVGIAHTYIAKEKLVSAAQASGHTIHIETQGTIGTEDALTEDQIAAADVCIVAADVNVSGRDRFKRLRVIEVRTETIIRSPNKFIKKVEEIVAS